MPVPMNDRSSVHAARLNQEMAATFPALPGLRLLAGHIRDHVADLFPEELEAVAGAVPRRQYEFATARVLARHAMQALGLVAAPVARGQRREPLWPETVKGSLTHAGDLAVAAVAVAHSVGAVGIDLEVSGRVQENLYDMLFSRSEQAAIRASRPAVAGLLFSAKEAAYKATFPLAGHFIDFHEVEVEPELAQGRFCLRYLGNREANRVMDRGEGYFLFCDTYVLSLFIIGPAS